MWLKFFKNQQNPTEAPQPGVKDHILFMLPPLAKNWPNQVEEINRLQFHRGNICHSVKMIFLHL